MANRRVIHVEPTAPLGEVTVVPSAFCGRPEAETARALAAAWAETDPPGAAADLLGRVRKALPFGAGPRPNPGTEAHDGASPIDEAVQRPR